MKTLVKMLMCMACMALLSSCEKDPDFSGSVNLVALKNFDANFIVHEFTEGDRPIITSDGCLKNWKGEGESLLLGNFIVDITLFCDIDNLCFANLIGTFHTEDGSALFFRIADGEYVCNLGENCEGFEFSFNDLAIIAGGTGRFAGATGSFFPNALIHNGESSIWFAKFSCKGDIILRPVNQGIQPDVGPLIPEPIP
jgi:hypothetical protein